MHGFGLLDHDVGTARQSCRFSEGGFYLTGDLVLIKDGLITLMQVKDFDPFRCYIF